MARPPHPLGSGRQIGLVTMRGSRRTKVTDPWRPCLAVAIAMLRQRGAGCDSGVRARHSRGRRRLEATGL